MDGVIHGKGVYKVIEGARRIKALRGFLSENRIPCYIVDGAVDDARIKRLALTANRAHRDKDNSLNIVYAQLIFEECIKGKIQESDMAGALANFAGMTTRQARKYISIIRDGSQAIQRSVSNCSIPINQACAIVSAFPDDEKKQDAYRDILQDASPKLKAAVLEEIRTGADEDVCAKDTSQCLEDINARVNLKKAEEALTDLLRYTYKGDVGNVLHLCQEFVKKYE